MVAINPPVLLPVDPNPNTQRYGIFTATNGPLDLPQHARTGGIQYQTSVCTLPYGYEVNCIPDLDTKTFTDGISTILGTPFVVIGSTLCGTIGYTEEEERRFVFDRLRAGEQATVEAIFSEGLVAQSPSLANNTPNATSLADAPTITAGIGELEAWLYARYGPAGVLHIPIVAADAVFSDYHVWRDGQVYRTPLGTAVSFGNYANVLPDGTDPDAGTAVFYITGQTTIWRTPDSDVFISPRDESIDKVHNQLRMYAEREYVVTYDCFAAAAQVALVREA